MVRAQPYGLVDDAAVAIDGETIVFAGPRAHAPAADRTIDLGGRLVTPGLIDPHTHLVYGGNRAQEWEQRLLGVDYAEIARAGGGILATVRATRAAGYERLLQSAQARLETLCAHGVTTIEIKSGYGLDVETEIRLLRIARDLGQRLPVDVRTTFLGAHAIPPEFRENPDAYVAVVCDEMLPQIVREKLADAVDAFCETIAFTNECRRHRGARACRHGRRRLARSVLFSARAAAAADRRVAGRGRADRGRDRLQSGHVAARLAAAGA